MSRPALTGEATDPLEDVIAKMRSHGLRRIPLVHDGRVVGIVTLDDVLARLGSELDDLGGIARRRTIQAGLSAGLPGFRDEIELRLREARDGVQRNGGRASDFLVREFDALRDRIRRTVQ
jgi:CBS domain-containing protein